MLTVLMSCYNSARFLDETIRSVLSQTHQDFEFLIIDDGSEDASPEIYRDYAQRDSRIRLIVHENRGAAVALNGALPQTKHNWIARIDPDDLMLPNRLERQLVFLKEHPNLAVASSLVQYIDQHSRVIGKSSSNFHTSEGVKRFKDHDWPVGFHHPAAVFRKDIILSLGGYRPEFWPADDTDLWNRVVDAGHDVLVQEEYLTRYRIHGASVSVGKFRAAEEKMQWVQACVVARHRTVPEPTWDQFLAGRNSMPWWPRMNARRRDTARAMYKAAVLQFSCRRYEKFLPRLLGAAMLEPWYVVQRVLPQFKRQTAA